MELDEVINGKSEDEPKDEAATEQQDQPVEQEAEGAPSAPVTEKHVPLAALEAERTQRQDWKEKAIRNEERLRQLEQQLQQQPRDPVAEAENRMQAMVLNTSEKFARKAHGDEVVDAAFARFKQEVEKNPALHAQALSQADPWDFVVSYGQRLAMMDEIGVDPKAYRAKVEAEIRAQLQPANDVRLPTSLGGIKSVGPRATPHNYAEPASLDEILKRSA